MIPPLEWSPWQPLPEAGPLTAPVLAEILDGGQSFRWHRLDPASAVGRGLPTPPSSAGTPRPQISNTWLGLFADHIVRLTLDPTNTLLWSAPAPFASRTAPALARYFDVSRNPRALADILPHRSDPHLAACIAAFPDLRILRQPFGETLLGFLCSATKQIPQIKQMLALLAQHHGTPLLPSLDSQPSTLNFTHRLPTWPQLAHIPERDLRACLLGFRARYISETAQFLAAHPGWLDETESLPYAAAKERLCSLPGVGEKVADCVLLFGAGKLEAFPVDTWIIKSMARRYGLDRWKPAQIAHFGRVHFGPLAGLAQQYLFAFERHAARQRRIDHVSDL